MAIDLESSSERVMGGALARMFAYRDHDDTRISAMASELTAAQPFPHLVIDDFVRVPPDEVVSAFPAPDWPGWKSFNDAYQFNKRQCADIDALPPLFQAMVHDLCGPAFLHFLEKVSGIRGLLPDPYLVGGGLHSSGEGGILAPHADFHHYPRLELFRRINVLVYFNPEWKPEFGGCLELYQKGATRPDREVVPEFGRMVMFLTDDRSIHGFTRPISGTPRWRNSLALYYYTSGETQQFSGDGDTHWQAHGKQDGVRWAKLLTYKVLLRVSRMFSKLAHRVNPNFQGDAAPIVRDET